MTIVKSASQTFIYNMTDTVPMILIAPEINWITELFKSSPTASTSFVNRLMISPVAFVSKYRTGSVCICSNNSFLSVFSARWDTPIMILCCKYVATSPVRYTPPIKRMPNSSARIPSWMTASALAGCCTASCTVFVSPSMIGDSR